MIVDTSAVLAILTQESDAAGYASRLADAKGATISAAAYTRPGRRPMCDDDRSWARSLTRAARRAEIPLWPVHFANDEELLVFAPDDLAGAA